MEETLPPVAPGAGAALLARDSWRVFVALELTGEARASVAALLAGLQKDPICRRAHVRWTAPGNVHLTLKFVERLPVDQLPAVQAALGGVAAAHRPFDLALSAGGWFEHHGAPGILWIGVRGDVDALAELTAGIERALAPLGLPAEERAFRPHVTVGRAGDPRDAVEAARAFVAAAPPVIGGPVATDSIVLFRSETRPQCAVHTPVWRARLGAALR